MSGHGWVTPNADGSVARCGGPKICKECQREAGIIEGRQKLQESLKAVEEPQPDWDLITRQLRLMMNAHAVDNALATPDYILAAYVTDVLKSQYKLIHERRRWFLGREDL